MAAGSARGSGISSLRVFGLIAVLLGVYHLFMQQLSSASASTSALPCRPSKHGRAQAVETAAALSDEQGARATLLPTRRRRNGHSMRHQRSSSRPGELWTPRAQLLIICVKKVYY